MYTHGIAIARNFMGVFARKRQIFEEYVNLDKPVFFRPVK